MFCCLFCCWQMVDDILEHFHYRWRTQQKKNKANTWGLFKYLPVLWHGSITFQYLELILRWPFKYPHEFSVFRLKNEWTAKVATFCSSCYGGWKRPKFCTQQEWANFSFIWSSFKLFTYLFTYEISSKQCLARLTGMFPSLILLRVTISQKKRN